MRVAELAALCPNLRVHLHVSTAYTHGDGGSGPMDEVPFEFGRTPKGGTIDVEAEVGPLRPGLAVMPTAAPAALEAAGTARVAMPAAYQRPGLLH
jgi:hypothetical protein